MKVKTKYNLGDTVWIYGINRSNVKPAQGKVIKILDLSDSGYTAGPHYVIEIPSHIESLLEIRTWENMSQDELGPVGSLRELGNIESTIKFVSTVGFVFDDSPRLDTDPLSEEDGPSPDVIHAALQDRIDASRTDVIYQPTGTKPRSRNKYQSRKKKI
jgi:hypothetical protein